ncbi:hypothetical protein [Rhodococcus chondri]|uniref:Uncharacterized protein n=1 Tax=Rhodococcus chondri TaxID=3065941 RepID=A0ABU7JYT5_9NOCA|nr:hypothetical protein [Rhodococcus sp. CC-R104]MEE2035050.1 hypothetical protein [Rhodococcus sp. CC-R104]
MFRTNAQTSGKTRERGAVLFLPAGVIGAGLFSGTVVLMAGASLVTGLFTALLMTATVGTAAVLLGP